MKVLWLRPSKGDNISVRRERIAEHLREQGFEVEIRDATGIDAVPAAIEAVRGGYDVIAGNVRVGLYLGYPLARLLRKPFLGDVSDPISDIDYLPSPLFRFFEWYEWKVLKRADAAVFVYESSYQEALERGVEDAVKLPNAVDYGTFAEPDPDAVEEARRILEEHGADLNKHVAVYLGVFSDSYLITEMIEASERTPDWEFVFLGEGALVDEVEEAADELDNFHYPGAFEYRLMPGFLSHADVGFCFKDAEQPLKLKEYGAAGIPAIAQPGELEKYYDEDELVFVEPTGEGISSALDDLEDKNVRANFGENLREVAKEYRWKDIANEYYELFEKITE